MKRDRMPPSDAEKCNKDILLKNFCSPPCLTNNISRSALIIGTRGSGKTYFLRTCRHTHKGVAVIGDLKFILNSITRDIGGAGLSFDFVKPSLEPLIRSKTMALVATWLVQTLKRLYSIDTPEHLLKKLVPTNFAITENMFLNVVETDIEMFLNTGSIDSFLYFFNEVSILCEDHKGQLLVLLDRSEDVPYPCLFPIFSLLDQSNRFLTIITSRPGIIGPQNLLSPFSMSPGDHFDVFHLGVSPYSGDWRNYSYSVLSTWLPNSFNQCPEDFKQMILSLSRDSLRNAVKIVYNSIEDESGLYDYNRFISQFAFLQESLLQSAQASLRHLCPDLKRFISNIRNSITPFKLPLLLEFQQTKQSQIPITKPFHDLPKSERFLSLALRSGFFTTKDSQLWHPFLTLNEVEIPPIYIWKEDDPWYDIQ